MSVFFVVFFFQITNNFGAPCDQQNSKNFMNNCNYSAAYDLLNFIYGGNLKVSQLSFFTHQSEILKVHGRHIRFSKQFAHQLINNFERANYTKDLYRSKTLSIRKVLILLNLIL